MMRGHLRFFWALFAAHTFWAPHDAQNIASAANGEPHLVQKDDVEEVAATATTGATGRATGDICMAGCNASLVKPSSEQHSYPFGLPSVLAVASEWRRMWHVVHCGQQHAQQQSSQPSPQDVAGIRCWRRILARTPMMRKQVRNQQADMQRPPMTTAAQGTRRGQTES